MSQPFGSSSELNTSDPRSNIELSALSRAKAKQGPQQVGAAYACNLEISTNEHTCLSCPSRLLVNLTVF
jgi:hypothetical protein